MDIFNGNAKLEEVVFTALDYALWSRHDIEGPFVPFAMLHKDGERKLIRLMAEGDPNEAFNNMLKTATTVYDQIAFCIEVRVMHGDKKVDAVMVRGFDTSEPTGLLVIQKFIGIESGQPFMKIGNPALYSREELLPVPMVPRDTNKKIEVYHEGMIVNDEGGLTRRVEVIDHNNASTIANIITDHALMVVKDHGTDFSGGLEYHLATATLNIGEFELFIFKQLKAVLNNRPEVLTWQRTFSRQFNMAIIYDGDKLVD